MKDIGSSQCPTSEIVRSPLAVSVIMAPYVNILYVARLAPLMMVVNLSCVPPQSNELNLVLQWPHLAPKFYTLGTQFRTWLNEVALFIGISKLLVHQEEVSALSQSVW